VLAPRGAKLPVDLFKSQEGLFRAEFIPTIVGELTKSSFENLDYLVHSCDTYNVYYVGSQTPVIAAEELH